MLQMLSAQVPFDQASGGVPVLPDDSLLLLPVVMSTGALLLMLLVSGWLKRRRKAGKWYERPPRHQAPELRADLLVLQAQCLLAPKQALAEARRLLVEQRPTCDPSDWDFDRVIDALRSLPPIETGLPYGA